MIPWWGATPTSLPGAHTMVDACKPVEDGVVLSIQGRQRLHFSVRFGCKRRWERLLRHERLYRQD